MRFVPPILLEQPFQGADSSLCQLAGDVEQHACVDGPSASSATIWSSHSVTVERSSEAHAFWRNQRKPQYPRVAAATHPSAPISVSARTGDNRL
jgi:hypothetical protein